MDQNPSAGIHRRCFLERSGYGIGGMALAQLLESEGMAARKTMPPDPLAPRTPHFAPRAKNVIFLFMAGAPSQLDLFDPKPKLVQLHNKPVPESFLSGLDDALIRGSARVWASPRPFRQHGQSGMSFSDYLPNMASCADHWCMVRSMVAEVSNHHPAQQMMNTGVPRFGLPSMGSWATYGLGSESKDLPGFVVLLSRNGSGDLGGTALWSNAFLPAAHRGVTFRSSGDSILHLGNPAGINRSQQTDRLAAIRQMNLLRFQQKQDPEILSRIAAYEMAFRMQSAAPELLDFAGESKATLEEYGIEDEKSQWFGTNCLLARRMVERGVRFVQLYHYTWDDHSNLNKRLKSNCEMTERGVAALVKDLERRGLLDETLVVWGGEFGRTPMYEVRRGTSPGSEGRDHHPFGFTMLMAGGGVKPGFVYGATDELGYHSVENPVTVHDLQATILHLLGLDHERLTYRFQGRDFRLTDVAGQVITDVIA